MILGPETIRVQRPRHNYVVFDKATPKFAQNEALENGLVGIIGEIAMRTINSAYRNVLSQNDINDFIDLRYYET